jgi:hypothetical protein
LPGLLGNSPEDTFLKFKEHLNFLLNKTVTDAPLSLLLIPPLPRALLRFWQNDRLVCVKVGRSYHLFIGQTLEAVKDGKRYRLRTLAYAYRITEGPSFDDRCLFRWEYNSREYKESLAPRHHLHFPATLRCAGNRILDTEALHIPSGWITIEEIIRFLVHELEVKPKSNNWDTLLRDSEQKFREWSGRVG